MIPTSPVFSCVSVDAFTFAAASVSTSVCGRNDSVSDRLVVSVTINDMLICECERLLVLVPCA